MKDKRHVKPKGFEDFKIVEVELPCRNWSRKYDIEKKIIWINTAVEEKNNVVKLEPAKL